MFNLYEQILKERYDQSGEIMDILQVFFLQVMAGENYQIPTDKVLEFIKEKLNINLTFEEIRSVLENIAVVDSIDEEVITLFDPEQVEAMEHEDNLFPGEEETANEVGADIEDQKKEEDKEMKDMLKSATDTAEADLKLSDSL